MTMFAETIKRNNDAVNSMLQGDSTTSCEIFRECFLSAKQTLLTKSHQRTTTNVVGDSVTCKSLTTKFLSSPLRPSSTAAPPVEAGSTSCEIYVFRQPLYIAPPRFFEDYLHTAHENDEQGFEACVGQVVSAAIIFNMALLFHQRGDRASLIKAQKLYRSVTGLTRQVHEFFSSTAMDLSLVACNNLLEVAIELGDFEQANVSLSTLQKLCGLRTSLSEDETASCFLIGHHESSMVEIVTNAIVLHVSTLKDPNGTHRDVTLLSSCAAAA